jgi:transcriptional regulator with XRE-family HTH domain
VTPDQSTRPSFDAKAELVRQGITQTAVAQRYGTSQQYVSDVLNGHRNAPERFRLLVAELTGCPEAELFEGRP